MKKVSLREPFGQPVQVALDGGEFRPVPSFVAEALRGKLGDGITDITDRGLVIVLRGEWKDSPQGCREVARMLMSRADALAVNGNGRGEDD